MDWRHRPDPFLKGRPMHIFLDMDGVIADFCHKLADDYACKSEDFDRWEVWEVIGIKKGHFWDWLNGVSPDWWAKVPLMSHAKELVEFLTRNSCSLTILTSGVSPSAAAGKVEWIKMHFPELIHDFVNTTNKGKVVKLKNELLIDDSPVQIQRVNRAGGKAFLFPARHNDLRFHVDDSLGYTKDRLNFLYGFE